MLIDEEKMSVILSNSYDFLPWKTKGEFLTNVHAALFYAIVTSGH